MSADNWTVCPQCKWNYDRAIDKALAAAGEAYGKVTPEEYLELRNKALKPPELPESFREDYSIGVDDDGEFSVSYRGACETCSLSFAHDFSQKIPMPKAPAQKGRTKP